MGILGVLMALLAGYLLWQMSELNGITSVLAHRNVPVSELAGEINTDTAEYRIMEFRYLIENDAQKSSAIKSKLDDVRKTFGRELKEIADLCISGNAKQSVIDIERGLKQYLDRSEEHTSELQSRIDISYAVFCLKKKTLACCS